MTFKHWVSLIIQFSVQSVFYSFPAIYSTLSPLPLLFLVVFMTLTLLVSFWVIVMLDFFHFFSMRSLVLFQIRDQAHTNLCFTSITNDWIELISSADFFKAHYNLA